MSRHDHDGSHKRRRIDPSDAPNEIPWGGFWEGETINFNPTPDVTFFPPSFAPQNAFSNTGHPSFEFTYINTNINKRLDDLDIFQPTNQKSNENSLQFNYASATHPTLEETAWNAAHQQQPVQTSTIGGQLGTEIVCFGMVGNRSL